MKYIEDQYFQYRADRATQVLNKSRKTIKNKKTLVDRMRDLKNDEEKEKVFNNEFIKEAEENNYKDLLIDSNNFYLEPFDVYIVAQYFNLPLVLSGKREDTNIVVDTRFKHKNNLIVTTPNTHNFYYVIVLDALSEANTQGIYYLLGNNGNIRLSFKDMPPKFEEQIKNAQKNTIPFQDIYIKRIWNHPDHQ